MIITLKGADFSASNIGTLSTWRITCSLGTGATYEGVTSVDKGAAFTATVTLAEGYEIGTAGVTITMGGTVLSGAHTIEGNVITITIASVTGNVLIKVPTINTATGEEEEPDTPTNYTFTINPTPSTAIVTLTASEYTQSGNSITVPNGTVVSWSVSADGYTTRTGTWTANGENKTENVVLTDSNVGGEAPNVTWTLNSSLNATSGAEIAPMNDRSRTNNIQVADFTGPITCGGTGSQFIISCYSGSTYLGQINASDINGDLVKGVGQWINNGTLISKELLVSKGVDNIAMVADISSYGGTFIMNGEVLAIIGGSVGDNENPDSEPLVIDFVNGSVMAANGNDYADITRWRSDYLPANKLTGSISVVGARFILNCYDSSRTYLGQLSTSGSGFVKTAQWYDSGAIANGSALQSASYVRMVVDNSEIQVLINGVDCFGEIVDSFPQ